MKKNYVLFITATVLCLLTAGCGKNDAVPAVPEKESCVVMGDTTERAVVMVPNGYKNAGETGNILYMESTADKNDHIRCYFVGTDAGKDWGFKKTDPTVEEHGKKNIGNREVSYQIIEGTDSTGEKAYWWYTCAVTDDGGVFIVEMLDTADVMIGNVTMDTVGEIWEGVSFKHNMISENISGAFLSE